LWGVPPGFLRKPTMVRFASATANGQTGPEGVPPTGFFVPITLSSPPLSWVFFHPHLGKGSARLIWVAPGIFFQIGTGEKKPQGGPTGAGPAHQGPNSGGDPQSVKMGWAGTTICFSPRGAVFPIRGGRGPPTLLVGRAGEQGIAGADAKSGLHPLLFFLLFAGRTKKDGGGDFQAFSGSGVGPRLKLAGGQGGGGTHGGVAGGFCLGAPAFIGGKKTPPASPIFKGCFPGKFSPSGKSSFSLGPPPPATRGGMFGGANLFVFVVQWVWHPTWLRGGPQGGFIFVGTIFFISPNPGSGKTQKHTGGGTPEAPTHTKEILVLVFPTHATGGGTPPICSPRKLLPAHGGQGERPNGAGGENSAAVFRLPRAGGGLVVF